MNNRRNSWYEDDVVEYTTGGRLPKIPKKYQYCKYYINGNKHILKAFRTYDIARIALCKSSGKISDYYTKKCPDDYVIFKCDKCCMYHVIFKCDKCCMYHILLKQNYNKKFYGRSNF